MKTSTIAKVTAALAMSSLAALSMPQAIATVKQPSEWAKQNLDKKTLKNLKRKYRFGPYPQELEAFSNLKPDYASAQYQRLYQEGTRNAVLNELRIAVMTFENGDFDESERLLDDALSRIESIYADDDRARAARSKWTEEAIKDWKGEPYERAMAYYYRGLLYLRVGDYENARASFRQAEFQDTLSESEEYQGDFALMNYLAGWASQCAADDVRAAEYFTQANSQRPNLASPSATANMLFIAETGTAPMKNAVGAHQEALTMVAGAEDQYDRVEFVPANGATLSTTVAGDIGFQATTRGGRAFQSVLNGKARFKTATNGIGDAGLNVGTATFNTGAWSGNEDLMGAGAAIAVGGAVFKMLAARAKPTADTRSWDNLPNSVRLTTGYSGNRNFTGHTLMDGEQRAATLMSKPGLRCGLVWSRSHSATEVLPSAPNAALTKRKQRRYDKRFGAADYQFRAQLFATNQ